LRFDLNHVCDFTTQVLLNYIYNFLSQQSIYDFKTNQEEIPTLRDV